MDKVGTDHGFCWETSGIWQFAGFAVMVLKIIIPAVLIILGIVALGKAVIAADDKEIKTAVNSLIKKFITAVIILFIHQIISGLFMFVAGFKKVEDDYNICVQCISNPRGNTCKTAVDATVKTD